MSRKPTVLVADDDVSIRLVIEEALERADLNVIVSGTMSELWSHIEGGNGDVLLTDVMMPDADGIEMLPKIKALRPELPVVVMSAMNTLTTAVRATEKGAFEYLPKPFDINELIDTLHKAIASKRTKVSVNDTNDFDGETPLVGRSNAMQKVYKIMARVMGTDLSILIEGASGTGKELVATALHEMGPRKKAPFVAVNMAAIPKDLVESELFGHEKGAFTGATHKYAGRFEQANGGTLFLDEIGDMPLEAQTRLLRVLQQGEFRSVGGQRIHKVNVRIIAATHQNLLDLVEKGKFREDLYFRLNVVPIQLPSLLERLDDIPDLVSLFLKQAVKEGLSKKSFTPEALEVLKTHNWPGNIRELKNVIRRFSALYSEDQITKDIVEDILTLGNSKTENKDLSAEEKSLGKSIDVHLTQYFSAHANQSLPKGLYNRIIKEVEKPLLIKSMEATKGNQIKASELLGLNRNTLRKKLKEHGIRPFSKSRK
jgi:two-component system nitrogen regulation response regulator GlnG